MKYKIGEMVRYNDYGKIKKGVIQETLCTTTSSENNIRLEYSYRILCDDDYAYVIMEKNIISDIAEETFEIIEKANEIMKRYSKINLEMGSICYDIIQYPNNNDWRIKNLKKYLKNLGE